MKKRAKYIQEYIELVNEYLYNTKEKDYNCPVMVVAEAFLMKHNGYEGFNFFVDKKLGDFTFRVLAGSSKKDEYEFIQLM